MEISDASTQPRTRGGYIYSTEGEICGYYRMQGKQRIFDWLAYSSKVKIDSIGKKGVEDVRALKLNEWSWQTSEKGRNEI